jgi:ABC-2 type transport system permease protein
MSTATNTRTGLPAPESSVNADPRDERRSPTWLIVARREVVAKLTDRSFLVGTLLTLAIITVFMGVQAYLGERTKSFDLAATSASSAMADRVAQGASVVNDKVKVTVRPVADDAAARAAVQDGSADAWLHEGTAGWVLTGKSDVDSSLESAAKAVVQRAVIEANARAAGTTPEAIQRGATLSTSILDGNAEKQGFAKGLGFAFSFLFYIAALGFGITLAMSVVEEKASRIVEIITTKIPVRHLLGGKIAGNTVLAFGQMALYVAIGLIGLSFTPYSSFLSSAAGPAAWFLVFFIVGFLVLACLFAVAGALASRTEDVQQTAMPLNMLVVGMFFGSLFLKGTALTIASFVPPLSAILMPARLAAGGVPLWEPALALLLLVLAAGAVVRVAERLYRRSLLQTQGRLSIRQAWSTQD